MRKTIFLLFFLGIKLMAFTISSDDNYKIHETNSYTIIYTDDYIQEANFIKNNMDEFLAFNNKSFGYKFDEPIRIILVSDKLQIPNAFSTQNPFNMGAYYNGGGGMNNYFASNSWLMTLFIHEMVHNYQVNAKKSKISKTLHKYLGNNFIPIQAGIVPFFTLPNGFLPRALLEGNAVLNESLYGNGGRLYNGELNAMKNSLVMADKMNTARFINNHLDFPYMTEKYIVGGFYMKYLMKVYGLDKVNAFYYENSIHSINPFLLNSTFVDHFGIGFEQSVIDFVNDTKDNNKGYKELRSKNLLNSSKSDVELSKIDNTIYFISDNLVNKKELNTYDIKNDKFSKSTTTLVNAKVFKQNDKLYTATSALINAKEHKFGLYDEGKYILPSSTGKDIKDIKNGKIAYVNIKESFLKTKLYIDDEFYSEVSSSATFDEDGNIYYFKQKGSKRVLYKNKEEIYKHDGYYSKIVDIRNNEVYFIANTKYGSSLYSLFDGKTYRLNKSDNITNAKIIDDDTAILLAIDDSAYTVHKVKIEKVESKVYFEAINNDEKLVRLKVNNTIDNTALESKNYNELGGLEFSSLYPTYQYDSEEGNIYSLNATFSDPVMYNMLNIYTYKNIDKREAGLSYSNERHIPFSLNLYNSKYDEPYSNERDYGMSFEVYETIIQKARHTVNVNAKYYMDEKNKDKKPVVLQIGHRYSQNFGLESSAYLSSDLKVVLKEDRDDLSYGMKYKANKHIYDEVYFNFGLLGLKSETNSLRSQKGINLVTDEFSLLKDNTNVFVETGYERYVKEISKVSAGLSKSLNFSKYYWSFPLSLRKEKLFYTHNQYEITSNVKKTINEDILGLTLDVLVLHNIALPVTLKYITNNDMEDDYKVKFSLGFNF